MRYKSYYLPVSVFMSTFFLLTTVQIMVARPMLSAERFINGAGWIDIIIISVYGAVVAFNMQDRMKVPRWRMVTWTIFSVIFFTQLFLGLSGFDKFLMTGKLYLFLTITLHASCIALARI